MAQQSMPLTADEMPVITRALLGIAFIMLLLSVCQFVAKTLLYMDYVQAGVETSLNIAPALHLALLTCLLIGLGSYLQRRADVA